LQRHWIRPLDCAPKAWNVCMSSFLGQLLHGHPRALSLVKCLDVVSQLLRRPSGQQAAHGYLCYKRFESINADKPDLEVLCSAKVFLVKAALEMPETRSTLMPYCALQVHLVTGIPRASIPYTCVYITDNSVLHTKSYTCPLRMARFCMIYGVYA